MLTLDGGDLAVMINGGAANLRDHAVEINDLNVFPIPDGDTGDNMLMTMMGGVSSTSRSCNSISDMARGISDGMLLSARGNSGVILSQFFAGISEGLSGKETANAAELGEAFRLGVSHAYGAVMAPAEGTILTVLREATEYACSARASEPVEYLDRFISEARRSLARTPELLPVLKKAGVVDSGGAGLIFIIEGMKRALCGEKAEAVPIADKASSSSDGFDPDAFGEDDELEFGYCTELLIRLQSSKTDIPGFNVDIFKEYLGTVGDSVVAVCNGSLLKIHVHTMNPDKVLAFGRMYGEFLKVKIENMSLQHNSSILCDEAEAAPVRERRKFGVVAVANGEGVKSLFSERGADEVIDGGQSMNPSAEAFIQAFDRVNADTVFVFPNNGNIILTARQAATLYPDSDIRVVESRTVGDGYAALSMFDTVSDDADIIEAELKEAMNGVQTAEISRCVRDAEADGAQLHKGDYIGFIGKRLLAVGKDRSEVLLRTADGMGLDERDICILICGLEGSADEADELERYIKTKYRDKEVYIIDGGQDVYDYILITE
ncbi:MAG: DAK2 domain-containing protein [Clostridia bacterium]|nr:DAK2 domain-containing protein [Clostridia bacterium]